MLNEDARSLPGAAQAALRTRAVRAVLDGMPHVEAARAVGVHPNAVGRWMAATGRAARSPGQQQEIIALVGETTPDELGLAGFLWTRDAVAELIAQRYGRWRARTTE